MIPRYTRREMGRIWTDAHRMEKWLEVELAVCDALAGAGEIPREAAANIRKKAAFDAARALEIEKTVQHDVIAFLTSVAEHVGPDSRFIHLGLTSSDVVDTANALLLREAADLILAGVDRLRDVLKRRALEHRRTPCIGRTHGIHAEPTTFGLKLAVFYAEFGRSRERVARAREAVSVGKISGAVGTFAHLEPAIEEKVCAACACEKVKIGEDRTMTLDYRPASFFRREYIRPKLVCPHCQEGVVQAELPVNLSVAEMVPPGVKTVFVHEEIKFARNLLEGRGLVSDALWSFQTPPLVFPRPAFEVWLPLRFDEEPSGTSGGGETETVSAAPDARNLAALLIGGMSLALIASSLGISERTVRRKLAGIIEALGDHLEKRGFL